MNPYLPTPAPLDLPAIRAYNLRQSAARRAYRRQRVLDDCVCVCGAVCSKREHANRHLLRSEKCRAAL